MMVVSLFNASREEGKLESKAVSGLILTLLLISIFTLAFNIQQAEAAYYYSFEITVTPEFPTTLDEVQVTISFDKGSISYQVTFGPVSQIGNEFFVEIDIYVPEISYPTMEHVDYTYTLGKLPAGSYSFTATVWVSGWGSGFEEYSKSFTVSPPTVPEFPMGFVLEIAFIPILFYIWWKRKQRIR